MTRRLSKVVGVMLFLLFVGGAIFVPAFHRAYCADNEDSHDATQCPICQLANTPIVTASLVVAPITESVVVDNVVLQVSIPSLTSLRGPEQARAPPIA